MNGVNVPQGFKFKQKSLSQNYSFYIVILLYSLVYDRCSFLIFYFAEPILKIFYQKKKLTFSSLYFKKI